jgi:hypothetical protein
MPSPRALLLVALLGACRSHELSYVMARAEFDSVTAYATGAEEPQRLAFRSEAEQWPWTLRVLAGTGIDWALAAAFGIEPKPRPIENPSEFARDNLRVMIDSAEDDIDRLAHAAVRALWIAAHDPQPLDQLLAIGVFERVLEFLDVDPLELAIDRGLLARVPIDPGVLEPDLALLDRVAPWNRGDGEVSELTRDALDGVITRLALRPYSDASTGRRLLRFFLRAAEVERDAKLRALFTQALIDSLAIETAVALLLRHERAGAVGDTARDEVRIEALRVLVRRSGPRALLWSLARVAPFENGENLRRTWIRMCSALPPELADAREGDGQSPLEFLYDVLKTDERQGLRTLAHWALAAALDPRGIASDVEAPEGLVPAGEASAETRLTVRGLSLDSSWADEWWRKRVLERGDRR